MLRPSRRAARRVVVGTLTAGLAAGAVTVGVAGAGADDAGPSTAPPADVAPAPVGFVQPDQAETFKVLRRARRASDRMPAAARQAAGPGRYGRNPDLARAITTSEGTGWVVPGDGVLCMVVPDPVDGYGVGCATTAEVREKGLTVGMTDETEAKATTLVPDGGTVQVVDDDSRTVVRPDRSGVATADVDTATAIAVDDGDGAPPAETPVMTPAEAATPGE